MQNGALSDYAEADNTRDTGPNHSNIASVLGMSVSTVAVICHTSVTAYVTGSNLYYFRFCVGRWRMESERA